MLLFSKSILYNILIKLIMPWLDDFEGFDGKISIEDLLKVLPNILAKNKDNWYLKGMKSENTKNNFWEYRTF